MDLDFNSNAGIPTKPHAIIAKTTIAIIQFLIIFAYAFDLIGNFCSKLSLFCVMRVVPSLSSLHSQL